MFFYFHKYKEKFDPARNERHSLVLFLVYVFGPGADVMNLFIAVIYKFS
jgi:hypothetical protein